MGQPWIIYNMGHPWNDLEWSKDGIDSICLWFARRALVGTRALFSAFCLGRIGLSDPSPRSPPLRGGLLLVWYTMDSVSRKQWLSYIECSLSALILYMSFVPPYQSSRRSVPPYQSSRRSSFAPTLIPIIYSSCSRASFATHLNEIRKMLSFLRHEGAKAPWYTIDSVLSREEMRSFISQSSTHPLLF